MEYAISSFLARTAGAMAMVADTPQTDMPAARQADNGADILSFRHNHIIIRAEVNKNTQINKTALKPTANKPAKE